MKKSHQAEIEYSHSVRGSWEPSSPGFGFNGTGEGAGGRPKSNEFMAEQERRYGSHNVTDSNIKPTKKNNLKPQTYHIKFNETEERLAHAKRQYNELTQKKGRGKEVQYFRKLILELECALKQNKSFPKNT